MAYDAIVIGARCAGSSTAMLLARDGRDVLLVDRASFPSEIPHGHFIHRHGPRRLADWGLLDEVLATGCPPVTTMTFDFGGTDITGRDLVTDGVPMGLGPRRAALDKVLLDAADAAGAEVREGFPVRELIWDGDTVVGVRALDGTEERATIVIGADGRNSAVARAVDAPVTHDSGMVSVWYFSYWSGVPDDGLEIRVHDERAIFAFPTNDGLFGVFVAFPKAELPRVRADIEGEFMAVIDKVPELSERIRAGTRADRFYGATQLPNFLRRPYGNGWALVGDAGCHKDPFMALGVCDAFRDADLLAEALDMGFTGRWPFDVALAGYEARRNDETLPQFNENLLFAHLQPMPPEALSAIGGMRSDPDASRMFMLQREGLVAG
jgi:2-polyprenyl-6-methoxyphenol hydroxylase-like FAD-dependent oxidoreductase